MLAELHIETLKIPEVFDNDPAEPHCFNLSYDIIFRGAGTHAQSITLPSSLTARFFSTRRQLPAPLQHSAGRELARVGSYTNEPDPFRLTQ